MVKHTCEKCKKEFNKKSTYLDHINKKIPCLIPKKILTDTHEKLTKTNKFDENICCNFCRLVFNRKDNLKRHMDKFCKVKKIQYEEKENILLIKDGQNKKQENEIKELKEKYTKLQFDNKNLQKNYKNLQKNYNEIEKSNKELYNNNKNLFKCNKKLEDEINEYNTIININNKQINMHYK